MAPISPLIPIIDLSLPKEEVTRQIKSAMTVLPFPPSPLPGRVLDIGSDTLLFSCPRTFSPVLQLFVSISTL